MLPCAFIHFGHDAAALAAAGILLRKLVESGGRFEDLTHVIVDEVHLWLELLAYLPTYRSLATRRNAPLHLRRRQACAAVLTAQSRA